MCREEGRTTAGRYGSLSFISLKGRGAATDERSASYIQREFSKWKLDERGSEKVLRGFEAVFQREVEAQEVYVPTVKKLFSSMVEEAGNRPRGIPGELGAFFAPDKSLVPPTYKGVSFNPLLEEYGERFDLLDFFSWARRVQERERTFRFLVLDASLYWIINAAGRVPVETYSKYAAGQAVDFLLTQLDELEIGGKISKSAEMRNRYMRAISTLFPNGAMQIVGARDLWENNDAYLQCLQQAIDFVAESTAVGAPMKIDRFAKYSRYNTEFQKWYTPLVLAEALYLMKAYGMTAKLGPSSETAFDSLILKLTQPQNYNIFWYTRPLDGRMPYTDYVFFNDSADTVEQKIDGNSQLARWLKELVQPFYSGPIKDVVEAVVSLKERISRTAENPPPPIPPTPGDWWFTWPPGSCG